MHFFLAPYFVDFALVCARIFAQGDVRNFNVPNTMQMQPFIGLTEEKAKQMSKDQRDGHCSLLNSLPDQLKDLVDSCYPNMLKLARTMCKGDGKEDKNVILLACIVAR